MKESVACCSAVPVVSDSMAASIAGAVSASIAEAPCSLSSSSSSFSRSSVADVIVSTGSPADSVDCCSTASGPAAAAVSSWAVAVGARVSSTTDASAEGVASVSTLSCSMEAADSVAAAAGATADSEVFIGSTYNE